MPLSDYARVEEWVSQFQEPEDQALARQLHCCVMTVSSDMFVQKMDHIIRNNIGSCVGNVGLYVETERRHHTSRSTGRRTPDKLFRESRGKHKRAYGAGPPVINSQNNPRRRVGSEGILAQMATEIEKQSGGFCNLKVSVRSLRIDKCWLGFSKIPR